MLLRIHRGLTISQRGRRAELMWTGIPEKMLPRKHRGAHVDRNFGENVTEEIPFEPPRSSCGQEFPGKYHRGIPFEVRNTVLQARNNSWTAGTNFKSTEVLGGIFPTEALFFFHRGLTQRLCWTGCTELCCTVEFRELSYEYHYTIFLLLE